MKIILGKSNTGKTSTALQLIKAHKNSIYITLDQDKSLLDVLKRRRTEFHYIKNCHLLDIKCILLEKGGLINNTLTHVVIDSINIIKIEKKTHLQKIKYLEDMERDFKLEFIVIFNKVSSIDSVNYDDEFREYINKHKVIELTKCTKFKKL